MRIVEPLVNASSKRLRKILENGSGLALAASRVAAFAGASARPPSASNANLTGRNWQMQWPR